MKSIVDGLAVEYKDEGQGPAILFLHGWMHDLGAFDGVASFLRGKYRIVRLDLPGFGKTELPPHAWHTDDYAGFVRDFLRKIGVEPVCIVGHSFGGRIILRGFASGVLKSDKIVLIDSAGYTQRNTPRLFIYKAIAKTGKVFSFFVPDRLYNALRRRLYKHAGSDYAEAGALSQTFLNTMNEKHWKDDPPRIHVPALILWGELDTTTPPEDGKRLSAAIPGARFKSYAGLGHSPHRQFPEVIANAIAEFV
jgi:pimeloyl-ACP methyl ester carboxylesterase